MIRTVALVLVSALGIAHAQPGEPVPPPDPVDARTRAAELFTSGRKSYDLGKYDDAIRDFQLSYELSSEPLLLFNIAQAYRMKRDCGKAFQIYKAYLRNDPQTDNRVRVEQWITEMETCERERRPAAPPAAPAAPIVIAPESSIVAAPRADHRSLRFAGLAVAATGGLSLITGVMFSFKARGSASDVERACADGCAAVEVEAIDQRGQRAQRAATWLYVGSGILAAAGTGLYVWSRMLDREVQITPAAGKATVGVTVHVTF